MTASSAYRASVPLVHAGREVRILLDWDVIAGLQQRFGKDAYIQKIAEALETRDVLVVSELLASGSGGAITAEELRKWAPPVVVSCGVLKDAWLLAWHGPSMQPEEGGAAAADPRTAQSAVTAILSLLRSLRRFGRASAGATSGG